MKDFLRGTLATFLRLLFIVVSLVFLIGGMANLADSNTVLGAVLIVVGILFGCMASGIKYWIGHIFKIR